MGNMPYKTDANIVQDILKRVEDGTLERINDHREAYTMCMWLWYSCPCKHPTTYGFSFDCPCDSLGVWALQSREHIGDLCAHNLEEIFFDSVTVYH